MGDAYTKEAYQLIYRHPDWQSTAQEYEDRFAANLYHTGYVQQAASTALTKLSDTLTAYYRLKRNLNQEQAEGVRAIGEVAEQVGGRTPDDWKVLEGALLRRDSSDGAGQIGRWRLGDYASDLDLERLEAMESYPLFQADADQLNRENIQGVLDAGNLRERMTMLYNGMFLNGGKTKEQIEESQSLKNLLLNVTEEDQEQMRAQGVDSNIPITLLEEMGQYEKRGDLFDTYSIARDLKRGRDKLKNKGNRFTRWVSGLKRAFSAAFSSKFTRNTKNREERTGLGREHYERLGIGLSQREMANGLDDHGNLQWKEGQAYFRMKTPVTAEGLLQTAGPSGTTLRMLGAYRLLGAGKQDLLYFRLALIAWMVSSRDHSLYEILVGSHNAGVKGDEDLTEAAVMYKTVSPLDVQEIRTHLAPDQRFPHETVYLKMLNELREERKANRPEDNKSRSLFRFKDRENEANGDYDALNYDAGDVALNIYTTQLYKVINTAQKYGDTIGRYQMRNADIEGIDRGEQKSELADRIYDMARLSARMAQDGLEERGSNEAVQETVQEFDFLESRHDRAYNAKYSEGRSAYRGYVYRGGKIPSAYRGTGEVVNQSFLSTSQMTMTAKRFCDDAQAEAGDKACFRYILNGKGAVNISSVSVMGGEREVLVPMGTVFRITKPVQEGYFHRSEKRFYFASEMSEEVKQTARNDAKRLPEEKAFVTWLPYQLMELEEVRGPGEDRRIRMEEKRRKSREARERLLRNRAAE